MRQGRKSEVVREKIKKKEKIRVHGSCPRSAATMRTILPQPSIGAASAGNMLQTLANATRKSWSCEKGSVTAREGGRAEPKFRRR